MLNYKQFIQHHRGVIDAAKKASLHRLRAVNLTGCTHLESTDLQIGTYISYLVDFAHAADLDERNRCLAHAVGTLISISRWSNGSLKADDDTVLIDNASVDLLNSQLADFCRMNPITFIGYVMTNAEFGVRDDSDLQSWISMQFDLLSKYSFTHYINLCHLIAELD